MRSGELFGIYPGGHAGRDGAVEGHTGAARLALAPAPRSSRSASSAPGRSSRPDAKLPKGQAEVKFGRSDRRRALRRPTDDRLVLRQITDEVMFEIRELTGQEYVDVYATKKAEAIPSETAHVGTHVERSPTRSATGARPRADGKPSRGRRRPPVDSPVP